MAGKLIGGPDLRLRLAALADVPEEFAKTWGHDAADKMRQTAPNARRSASRRFTTKAVRLRAAVYGAFWWIFIDRGTKAHDILGSGRKNPPNVLMFEAGGETIFASKVHKKRTRRVPFITRAAQEALAGSGFAGTVIRQWNSRRRASHASFL